MEMPQDVPGRKLGSMVAMKCLWTEPSQKMCKVRGGLDGEKKVLHPRNLTNLIPKVAILFKGVMHLFQASFFLALQPLVFGSVGSVGYNYPNIPPRDSDLPSNSHEGLVKFRIHEGV